MKRIVIHAGPGKTGTSAIQHWLNTHVQQLAQDGILYPGHTTDPNQVSSGNLLELYRRDPEGQLILDESKVEGLLARFHEGPWHTLLLSSEFFFFKIIELHAYLPNCEFVVYLRNPIELAESSYNQEVKRHGRTTGFRISPEFESRIVSYLKTVFEMPSPPSLVIRPYATEFFHRGDIISDLLHTMGSETASFASPETGSDRRVNASYSFEALEFKRHANHFPLGPLEHDLDRTLQRCPFGKRDYSFIPAKLYDTLRERLISGLDDFIERFDRRELREFSQHLANLAPPTSRRQTATRNELERVANYLREETPDEFARLSTFVVANPRIALPTLGFYEIFGVRYEPASSEEDIVATIRFGRKLAALFRVDEQKTQQRVPDLLREMAIHFESRGDLANAILYVEAAHRLRPDGERIRTLLNNYRSDAA